MGCKMYFLSLPALLLSLPVSMRACMKLRPFLGTGKMYRRIFLAGEMCWFMTMLWVHMYAPLACVCVCVYVCNVMK